MTDTFVVDPALSEQFDEIVGETVDRFEPFAYYNPDGDCIEFFIAGEMYYGERIDDFVTVYRDIDTEVIIGFVLKNIKKIFKELSEKQPGFSLIIENNKVRIEHLFIAKVLSQSQPSRVYKELADIAEQSRIGDVSITSA